MDASALKYVIPKLLKNNNNNAIALTPDYSNNYWGDYGLLTIDPTLSNTFIVDFHESPFGFTGSINYRIDVYGIINTNNNRKFYYFAFNLDQTIAVKYPGLEFTVYFINPPDNRCYVGVYPDATPTSFHGPDMLSPGNAFDAGFDVSITLKSDGTRFRVVSSSPVSWSGYYDC